MVIITHIFINLPLIDDTRTVKEGSSLISMFSNRVSVKSDVRLNPYDINSNPKIIITERAIAENERSQFFLLSQEVRIDEFVISSILAPLFIDKY